MALSGAGGRDDGLGAGEMIPGVAAKEDETPASEAAKYSVAARV